MSQSRLDSVLESILNIFIGAFVALLAQLLWFPIIGKEFTLTENIFTTAVFTIVSFSRSYCIRRAFNGRSIYKTIRDLLFPINKK